MTPKPLPARAAELMRLHGAVVLFGPDYLKNSMDLLKLGALEGLAVLSAERIDDLAVPSGTARGCSMTFFHRKPAEADWGRWDTALLEHVDLSSPDAPAVELAPAANGGELQLILTWTRPLETSLIVGTARAIERAYAAHGGRYDEPGVFRRLRRLFT